MSKSDEHFVEFKEHTRLKHRILHAYLQAWAAKLLHRVANSVHFVDAFAGEGADGHGNPGSPLIAMEVARATRFNGSGKRVLVTAIESDPTRFSKLQSNTRSIVSALRGDAAVLRGSLAEHLDSVLQRNANAPTLTFLDPFGLRGLDFSVFTRLLAGPKNEVFFLFSLTGAIRHHGVLTSDPERFYRVHRRIMTQPLLFDDVQRGEESAALRAAQRSHAALLRTAAASRRIMAEVFGEQWDSLAVEMRGSDDPQGLLIEFLARRTMESGASHFFYVPMCGTTGEAKYLLVHASKSAHAFRTMKECVSTSLNKPEFSEVMRQQIRDDLSIDLDELLLKIVEDYGGTCVPWSAQPGPLRSEEGTLKRRLLDETPLFPFQVEELKGLLKARGWLVKINRRECVEVPTAE